jgi:hypothetical protein
LQLGPGFHLRQQGAREHQRLADPVGFFDDAQAVGITVGDEDTEGEKGAGLMTLIALLLMY